MGASQAFHEKCERKVSGPWIMSERQGGGGDAVQELTETDIQVDANRADDGGREIHPTAK